MSRRRSKVDQKHVQHCQKDLVLISGSTFFEVIIGLTKLQAKIYSAPR